MFLDFLPRETTSPDQSLDLSLGVTAEESRTFSLKDVKKTSLKLKALYCKSTMWKLSFDVTELKPELHYWWRHVSCKSCRIRGCHGDLVRSKIPQTSYLQLPVSPGGHVKSPGSSFPLFQAGGRNPVLPRVSSSVGHCNPTSPSWGQRPLCLVEYIFLCHVLVHKYCYLTIDPILTLALPLTMFLPCPLDTMTGTWSPTSISD